MRQRTLIIMVKEPRPGRVKTRLGAEIGAVGAAWWFRHQTRALIRRLGRDPRWQTVLAVAPDQEGLASRVWPPDIARVPQGRGSLGDRMGRLLKAAPPGPAMVIGADIPGITPSLIDGGFRALGRRDAVIGPAPDGGYWLIGLARRQAPPPGLFAGVRWSGPHAMTDTLATLGTDRVAQLATLRDVDELSDLKALADP
ncbi:TIGR04282 family arsenosugar biosynthesis glycosyltransferase [Oceanomicrobium pacificus]|uniref:DUF2064 domain-containing protein n=1 Tax=Oceanomicrobium pacificus TaxID=2692916 RepID=A0A6B0TSV0_9RHOB|nr:TIGR04282 family arsenosugar biosynthesis glycosyltransferase [Oceanomicrobium pacificus]MXU64073.1 DUF2064 domain-containing protein [Oceanomicrobium pacificus]